jgi:hypothetical protein
MGGIRDVSTVLVRNPVCTKPLEDLGVHGSIILKCALKEQGAKV